jgi:predicted NACHT family NTPase
MISKQIVNFQGNEVCLGELIDLTNRDILSSILLTEILEIKSISKPYSSDQDFYIQRDLVRDGLKSRGDLSKLRQFMNDSDKVMKEENLLEDSRKIFLLADSVGSGKTTFLQQIAKKLNQKFHNEWIIFIDLNRYRNEFTEESFENQQKVEEFLRKDVFGLKNSLEIKIFNHALEDVEEKTSTYCWMGLLEVK